MVVKQQTEVQNKQSKTAFRSILIVSSICLFFMIVEFVGGLLSGSLAILTDAAHLLSDFSGFMISLASIWVGQKPANKIFTFGYHRAEVIGAVLSVLLIWVLTAWLVAEAINRVINPVNVDGTIMLITSVIGLFCNITMACVLFYSGKSDNNYEIEKDYKLVNPEDEEDPN